ncbi:MFS transporter [uncultured Jannaschia sp.]|uniref:MFS transporter n=1 Tax=uncultured Jannaschia sp. TaxID=293347 RepID=UPI00262EA529|nr:MFS transporter [uncultured Jannaschia sp.]
MAPIYKLPAAGFAATAMTYGPARMGFGLFLSDFRETFSISTQVAGLIAGLGFFGFLLGLLLATFLTRRFGPKFAVVAGLAAAAGGMALIAGAPGLPVFVAGVFLAMSSAGFTWAPFNDAVHDEIPDGSRAPTLSVISTGTSLGIAAAGLTALGLNAAGLSWRMGWTGFAAACALVLLVNWLALPRGAGTEAPVTKRQWRDLRERSAIPLYIIALSFGTTSAIYISFAAERVAASGGLPGMPGAASAAIVFVLYGLVGLAGLGTGRLEPLLGLANLLRLLMAASTASLLLVALTPTSWIGIGVSAGLQGVFVMMMSAVLAFWSERLFPALPAFSFAAVLLFVATGSVLGPIAAGFVSGVFGPTAMFAAAAVVPGATALMLRPGAIQARAVAA